MKNFLFNKFDNFTLDMEMEFHRELTKSLPATNPDASKRGFANRNPVIWGQNSNGLWTMTRTEARFYENDGTIHAVGKRYDDLYVSSYRLLTTKIDMRSLYLIESDRLAITNSNHINFPQGETVYYAKFLSPEGELGWPSTSTLLSGKTLYNTEYYKSVIDYGFKILEGLRATGGLCPPIINPRHVFYDSKGVYLGILKDFSVSFDECMSNTDKAGLRPAIEYDANEVIKYISDTKSEEYNVTEIVKNIAEE